MDDRSISKDALRSDIRTSLALSVARARMDESRLDELEELFRRIHMTAKEHPSLHARLVKLLEDGDLTAAAEELERFDRADAPTEP